MSWEYPASCDRAEESAQQPHPHECWRFSTIPSRNLPQIHFQLRLISEGFLMQSPDFFRCRIDSMIDLRKPLAVLAQRLPWEQIEEALAPKFKRKEREVCSQSIQRDFGVCDAIGLRWR
jgi:hypothetical protein